MRRRDLIKVIAASAVTLPLAARAQQPERMRRVGVLLPGGSNSKEAQRRFTVFRDGLKQLGWVEDNNIRFDVRSEGVQRELTQAAVTELLALAPDAILANGATSVSVLQQQTQTTPIVFVQVLDPVAGGFVTSLAQPGGNATGFVNFEYRTAGKWMTLLREIAPNVNRVTVIHDPLLGASAGLLGAVQAVGEVLGFRLNVVSTRDAAEIERAVEFSA